MHDCPECGQACYCSGDIDDSPSSTEGWVYANCIHCAFGGLPEEDEDADCLDGCPEAEQ